MILSYIERCLLQVYQEDMLVHGMNYIMRLILWQFVDKIVINNIMYTHGTNNALKRMKDSRIRVTNLFLLNVDA